MELQILRTFLAVAETGTIARSSEKLHTVQSNVTTRIKSLEQELGVALFERRRSGMVLTAAGEHFLPYAQRVLRDAEDARQAVSGFSHQVRLLRLGSMETTLALRLPDYLGRFRTAHPGLSLRLRAGPSDELVTWLLDRELDLAFVGGAVSHPELHARPVFREEMVLVLPAGLSGAEEALRLPMAVFRHGCSYREFTLGWMRQAGMGPNEIFELGTLDGILGCVAAGIAVTCLPRAVLERSLLRSDLTMQPLGPEAVVETQAVTRRGAPDNGAVTAFLALF